jgi:hypothetical protein
MVAVPLYNRGPQVRFPDAFSAIANNSRHEWSSDFSRAGIFSDEAMEREKS